MAPLILLAGVAIGTQLPFGEHNTANGPPTLVASNLDGANAADTADVAQANYVAEIDHHSNVSVNPTKHAAGEADAGDKLEVSNNESSHHDEIANTESADAVQANTDQDGNDRTIENHGNADDHDNDRHANSTDVARQESDHINSNHSDHSHDADDEANTTDPDDDDNAQLAELSQSDSPSQADSIVPAPLASDQSPLCGCGQTAKLPRAAADTSDCNCYTAIIPHYQGDQCGQFARASYTTISDSCPVHGRPIVTANLATVQHVGQPTPAVAHVPDSLNPDTNVAVSSLDAGWLDIGAAQAAKGLDDLQDAAPDFEIPEETPGDLPEAALDDLQKETPEIDLDRLPEEDTK